MPEECKLWACRWLLNEDTADQARPDRSHLVIDLVPDYITLRNDETMEAMRIPVVQVWIDPRYPDAHRAPAFRDFVERQGAGGSATIVRFDSGRVITLFPPSMSSDGEWHEIIDGQSDHEHSLADIAEVWSAKDGETT